MDDTDRHFRPPSGRPSIAVDGGAMRGEDDSYKPDDAIMASASVRRWKQEGAPAHVVREFEPLLQVNESYQRITAPCRHIHG